MPRHGQVTSDAEAHAGTREALRAAIHGAAVWGLPFLLGGAVAQAAWPLYRGLTAQFKVYIQMSGMTVGSIIEADRRMRDFETHARRMRKVRRDQEVWRQYEEEFEKEEDR